MGSAPRRCDGGGALRKVNKAAINPATPWRAGAFLIHFQRPNYRLYQGFSYFFVGSKIFS